MAPVAPSSQQHPWHQSRRSSQQHPWHQLRTIRASSARGARGARRSSQQHPWHQSHHSSQQHRGTSRTIRASSTRGASRTVGAVRAGDARVTTRARRPVAPLVPATPVLPRGPVAPAGTLWTGGTGGAGRGPFECRLVAIAPRRAIGGYLVYLARSVTYAGYSAIQGSGPFHERRCAGFLRRSRRRISANVWRAPTRPASACRGIGGARRKVR